MSPVDGQRPSLPGHVSRRGGHYAERSRARGRATAAYAASLGLASLAALSSCYQYHTAYEDEGAVLEPELPATDADAGLFGASSDAGTSACDAIGDPLQRLTCLAGQTQVDAGSTASGLQDLLDGLLGGAANPGGGGAVSLEDLLGDLLGGGTTPDSSGAVSIEDLLGDLFGGGAVSIEDLFGGANRSRDGGALGAGPRGGSARSRDGGPGAPSGARSIDCANPSSTLAQIVCGAGRGDAGARVPPRRGGTAEPEDAGAPASPEDAAVQSAPFL